MQIIYSCQIPKDLQCPELNEDYILCHTEAMRVAVSDGASESFDSKSWAEILCNAYINNGYIDGPIIHGCQNIYSTRHNISTLSWSKQAAYERGSFATLLGVSFNTEKKEVLITAIGDSIAVLLDGNELIDSFPYNYSIEFQSRPELFCTNDNYNNFINQDSFLNSTNKRWSFFDLKNPYLLCMTDALAEWAFKSQESGMPIWELMTCDDCISELEAIVLTERESKNMRTDDVSFVLISLGSQ